VGVNVAASVAGRKPVMAASLIVGFCYPWGSDVRVERKVMVHQFIASCKDCKLK
jgi:hypothetical protein